VACLAVVAYLLPRHNNKAQRRGNAGHPHLAMVTYTAAQWRVLLLVSHTGIQRLLWRGLWGRLGGLAAVAGHDSGYALRATNTGGADEGTAECILCEGLGAHFRVLARCRQPGTLPGRSGGGNVRAGCGVEQC